MPVSFEHPQDDSYSSNMATQVQTQPNLPPVASMGHGTQPDTNEENAARNAFLAAGAENALQVRELPAEIMDLWRDALKQIQLRWDKRPGYNEEASLRIINDANAEVALRAESHIVMVDGQGTKPWKMLKIQHEALHMQIDALTAEDMLYRMEQLPTPEQDNALEIGVILSKVNEMRILLEVKGIPLNTILPSHLQKSLSKWASHESFRNNYTDLRKSLAKATPVQKQVIDKALPELLRVFEGDSEQRNNALNNIKAANDELTAVNRTWGLNSTSCALPIDFLQKYFDDYRSKVSDNERRECSLYNGSILKAFLNVSGYPDWAPDIDVTEDNLAFALTSRLLESLDGPVVPSNVHWLVSNGGTATPQPTITVSNSVNPPPPPPPLPMEVDSTAPSTVPSNPSNPSNPLLPTNPAGPTVEPAPTPSSIANVEDYIPTSFVPTSDNPEITRYGKVEQVRRCGFGYRIIVNQGTEQKPLMKAITSSFLRRGLAKQLYDMKPNESLSIKGRKGDQVKEVMWMVEFPEPERKLGIDGVLRSKREPVRLWGITWKAEFAQGRPSNDVITHSDMCYLFGKRWATDEMIQLKLRNQKNAAWFEQLKAKGLHPDTKQPLTEADKRSHPWLAADIVPSTPSRNEATPIVSQPPVVNHGSYADEEL